jgi:threonine dehydrogenase-like Zn-dependent dehydrogenase
MTKTMRALVFHGDNDIRIDEVPVPNAGLNQAVVKVSLTTICGTDVHIMRQEWPVAKGRILGHEAVGTVHELGPGVSGFHVGQRVLVPAITPCGTCFYCLKGQWAQCAGQEDKWVAGGGWRLGNSVDGCQADYFLVPYAQANLAPVPDALTDRQVVLLADIASTGFSASEKAGVGLGDTVAIFAQGPIGLCASVGARLKGAGLVIAVDSVPNRLKMALRLGADVALNFEEVDAVEEIRRLTQGRGVDVAIEALGSPGTFANGLKVIRPGGTLSSLGIYSGDLTIAPSEYIGGLGDQTVVDTLCPGGRLRMESLMTLVENHRVDLTPLLTHTFSLAQLPEAYDLFSHQRDGVLKVAVTV